jgi:hypothetical protein
MTPSVKIWVKVSAATEEVSKISVWYTKSSSPPSIPKSEPKKKNRKITEMGGAWSNERPF